ncbi:MULTISPECIES: Lrp/AsnC ligand binding domain-containing protein [unclassified Bradyrhizobium]|uniref:Lrp/AsnC ligand binding domain-containing protein n=1 Tax=unclassified Bradyrhizobium TaxID=2631580 RepID=UPI001FFA1AF1|nr:MULTISPECIES: Lrp/AsnC ligand binding domain-containing protein [unclassified Bradyrhizobium]
MFEIGVLKGPSLVRCFLMSGSDDYLLIVLARDVEDFERIHRTGRILPYVRSPIAQCLQSFRKAGSQFAKVIDNFVVKYRDSSTHDFLSGIDAPAGPSARGP